MKFILFSDGTKIGEISEWQLTERFPEKKFVLGKEIVTQKPKDQCQFTSPKPVHRRNRLWLISEDRQKWVLTDLAIQHGTKITATIDTRTAI